MHKMNNKITSIVPIWQNKIKTLNYDQWIQNNYAPRGFHLYLYEVIYLMTFVPKKINYIGMGSWMQPNGILYYVYVCIYTCIFKQLYIFYHIHKCVLSLLWVFFIQRIYTIIKIVCIRWSGYNSYGVIFLITIRQIK